MCICVTVYGVNVFWECSKYSPRVLASSVSYPWAPPLHLHIFGERKNAYDFYIHAIKLRRSKKYILDHSVRQRRLDRASCTSIKRKPQTKRTPKTSDAITINRDALQPFTTFELAFDQMHFYGSLLSLLPFSQPLTNRHLRCRSSFF